MVFLITSYSGPIVARLQFFPSILGTGYVIDYLYCVCKSLNKLRSKPVDQYNKSTLLYDSFILVDSIRDPIVPNLLQPVQ